MQQVIGADVSQVSWWQRQSRWVVRRTSPSQRNQSRKDRKNKKQTNTARQTPNSDSRRIHCSESITNSCPLFWYCDSDSPPRGKRTAENVNSIQVNTETTATFDRLSLNRDDPFGVFIIINWVIINRTSCPCSRRKSKRLHSEAFLKNPTCSSSFSATSASAHTSNKYPGDLPYGISHTQK